MVVEVGLQDLEQALEDGALLLDVREGDEYADGHVPGAQLNAAVSAARPDARAAS